VAPAIAGLLAMLHEPPDNRSIKANWSREAGTVSPTATQLPGPAQLTAFSWLANEVEGFGLASMVHGRVSVVAPVPGVVTMAKRRRAPMPASSAARFRISRMWWVMATSRPDGATS
jgi:hypothetical protein